MLEIFQAILLGIVEGLTEFLPISSTGHLIVSERVLGYKDTAEIFTVVIQMGAIFAVIWFYRKDLIEKISALIKWDKKAVNFWANLVIATIPAMAMGYVLKDYLDKYAVAMTVAVTLILGGIAIWLIESYHKAPKSAEDPKIDQIKPSQALKIGLFQVLALVPGVSRSGSTIMGGLWVGLDRVTATAFSFYLSMPVILVAGSYQLLKAKDDLSTVTGGWTAMLIGTLTAFFTALIAIKWLLHYVAKNNFKIFAYYRIILGIAIIIALI